MKFTWLGCVHFIPIMFSSNDYLFEYGTSLFDFVLFDVTE